MTIPIPECTRQEHGPPGTHRAARCDAGVGFEPSDAGLELECGNGKLAPWPTLALDFPPGEAP